MKSPEAGAASKPASRITRSPPPQLNPPPIHPKRNRDQLSVPEDSRASSKRARGGGHNNNMGLDHGGESRGNNGGSKVHHRRDRVDKVNSNPFVAAASSWEKQIGMDMTRAIKTESRWGIHSCVMHNN